ncbi:hypothetical protein GCM10009654_16010 [Streptomyces hebeiensis]|uniref:Transposase IS30-like HTH domain-containing protein n=1 Tax=Streptomyces hebeiensis TaxID=229486 RepID=A0ABN1UP07_9ACTN
MTAKAILGSMPGGRLTQQDRRRVAAGLADGLPSAEIARRLDRPTSTISRETGRNGGPGGHEPRQAHLETVRRARRGTPAPAYAAGPPGGTAGEEINETRSERGCRG